MRSKIEIHYRVEYRARINVEPGPRSKFATRPLCEYRAGLNIQYCELQFQFGQARYLHNGQSMNLRTSISVLARYSVQSILNFESIFDLTVNFTHLKCQLILCNIDLDSWIATIFKFDYLLVSIILPPQSTL